MQGRFLLESLANPVARPLGISLTIHLIFEMYKAKTSGSRQGRRNRVSLQVCLLIQLLQYQISRTRGVYTRPISRPCNPRRGILTCLFPGSYSTIFPLPHVRCAACLTSVVKDRHKNNKWTANDISLVLPQGFFKLYPLLTASASCREEHFSVIKPVAGRAVKNDAEQRDTAEVKIPNNLIEHFLVMA